MLDIYKRWFIISYAIPYWGAAHKVLVVPNSRSRIDYETRDDCDLGKIPPQFGIVESLNSNVIHKILDFLKN